MKRGSQIIERRQEASDDAAQSVPDAFGESHRVPDLRRTWDGVDHWTRTIATNPGGRIVPRRRVSTRSRRSSIAGIMGKVTFAARVERILPAERTAGPGRRGHLRRMMDEGPVVLPIRSGLDRGMGEWHPATLSHCRRDRWRP